MSRHVSTSSRVVTPALVVALALVGVAPARAATTAPKLVGYTPAPGSRAWPIDEWLMRFTPAADSAWRRTPAEGIAFGDSLLRRARARRDRTLEAAVHVWRGRKYANDYRLGEGKPDLDTAWTIASALRDSAGLSRVLAARALGATLLGRDTEAVRDYRRLISMAGAAGLPGLVGFAHRGLGMWCKMTGDYDGATRHLRAAIRRIPDDRFENRHSRFLLAEVVNRQGRPDEARGMFLKLLDEARGRKDRWLQAALFNDLGNLEYEGGDMATADRYWAFAAGVFDSTGNAPSAVNTRINRAIALRGLGRTDEARVLLERVLADAATLDDPGPRIAVLGELGMLCWRTGRLEEAERLMRAVRAASAAGDALGEEATSISLAGLLRETGRAVAAEALLDSLLAPGRRARMTADNVAAAQTERSAALRAQGRAREALVEARRGERWARNARKASAYGLDAAIELARCHRDLGAPDSAVAVLRRAAASWERWRASISDLEWRERSGAGLAALFAEYGLALLDPRRATPEAGRARQAFDALQAFQARTLEERMRGTGLAGSAMRRRITSDSLRRGVLRDGELLIDLVATPDTTFAFLVSRRGVEARRLPGARRLERLYADWQEATTSGADAAVAEQGLRRLSEVFLAPLAPSVRTCRRVIVTGGGPLALWPLGALTLSGDAAPLGESRELFTAPSATLFAALRARLAGPARRGRGLLAVGRTTDGAGRELPGAERELQALGSRYDGVEVRMNRGERSLSELTHDLARWDVLHFAAHAEAELGSPWRAGFLLGRGNGDDAFLRASRVAAMKLPSRLAVLSGCQSAGATTLAGEGALGLASAFLCSGTTTVVATLWPVEDRIAQRFVAEFYAALARGRSVAAAVGEAQRALRARPDSAGPRDWAAFMAAGEAGTRVRLVARSGVLGGSP